MNLWWRKCGNAFKVVKVITIPLNSTQSGLVFCRPLSKYQFLDKNLGPTDPESSKLHFHMTLRKLAEIDQLAKWIFRLGLSAADLLDFELYPWIGCLSFNGKTTGCATKKGFEDMILPGKTVRQIPYLYFFFCDHVSILDSTIRKVITTDFTQVVIDSIKNIFYFISLF